MGSGSGSGFGGSGSSSSSTGVFVGVPIVRSSESRHYADLLVCSRDWRGIIGIKEGKKKGVGMGGDVLQEADWGENPVQSRIQAGDAQNVGVIV